MTTPPSLRPGYHGGIVQFFGKQFRCLGVSGCQGSEPFAQDIGGLEVGCACGSKMLDEFKRMVTDGGLLHVAVEAGEKS